MIKNDKPLRPQSQPARTQPQPARTAPKPAAAVRTAFARDELSTGRTAALRTMLGGSRPTAVVAVANRTLSPASVAQANADYDANKNWGAATTRVMIELMKQHAGDPDYLAQLVSRAKDQHDGVLDYMMGNLNGAFMRDSGGSYVSGFDDSDRAAITNAIRAGLEAGTITEQELRDRAATSPGWADVAARLGVAQAGATTGSVAANEQLRAMKGEYDAAHQAVLEKEQRLAQELAAMGPALTDDQRSKFIQAFRSDPANAEAYGREAAAAKALADHLSANKAALLDAATRDPRARQELYDTLKALADSGQGKTALEFAVEIQRDPSSPLGQAFASYTSFDDEITMKALPGAAAQLLAEGADPQSALAQIKALVAPLSSAWKVKIGATDLGKAWTAIEEAALGKYEGLATLAREWDGKPGPMKLLSALGVAFGAAGATNQLAQGNYLAALKGFASAGQGGLELLAGATKSLADAGKLAQFGEQGLRFASFAERLAPGLGVVASATAFVLDLQAATRDGGNLGYAVAALGDALGVLGSAMEVFPLTAPAGVLVSGIGAIISGVGGLVGLIIDGNELKDEQRRFLEAAGVPEPMRSTLLEADREQVEQLRQLGLTPEQIQQLATNYPQLVQSSHGFGPQLSSLLELKPRLGLTGDQLFELLNASGPGTGYVASAFASNFFPEITNSRSVAELAAHFRELARETTNEEQAAAFNAAAAYLESVERPYGGPH
ncbi:MAG: hypothetical protein IT380_25740 [Myxococcales bacterium]|nr:hypothetical protein [Myxococcales bacterium]